MPTNNIKLFDENKVNMLTDVEYNTNAQRINGVQSGVASSKLQNKTLYQTSLISYAIAQFMNEMGFDASDSGAVYTFVNNLSSSIKKPADSDVKYISQTLTDAQKQQARANIAAAPDGFGLGIIDWNQAPESDANKIPGTGWFLAAKNGPTTNGIWFIRQEFDGPSNNDALQTAWPQNLVAYYRGCLAQRYQISGTWSAWEWVNPPMMLGVEYRTTERYLGKPVYKKMIEYTGALTADYSQMSHNIANIDAVCGCYAELFVSAARLSTPRFDGDNFIVFSASQSVIIKQSNADYSSYSARVTLSYTKSTD